MPERVHQLGSFRVFLLVVVDFCYDSVFMLQKTKMEPPKMEIWKINFLFKGMIFRSHINFDGCTVNAFQVSIVKEQI